jgi:hypothetical protein
LAGRVGDRLQLPANLGFLDNVGFIYRGKSFNPDFERSSFRLLFATEVALDLPGFDGSALVLGSNGSGGSAIDLEIDIGQKVARRGGKEISLTSKEFALLEYLIRNANRVVSKIQILENVWNMDFDPESNVVEVYMHQLRKKIDKGFETPVIETIIGVGYKLKGTKSSL